VRQCVAAARAESARPSPAGAGDSKDQLMAVYEIDPLRDPRWNDLVASHPCSSVFHSQSWLRALSSVYGYESVALTTCPSGTRLTNAIVFSRIHSWLTGPRLVSLPFSDHCEPLIEKPAEADAMLDHMKREVGVTRGKYIEIRPIVYVPSDLSALSKGHGYVVHRLDLRPPLQEIFREFHKDCVQRKIRRAEREKLHYQEGTSEELLQKFYQLLVMSRRRQYLPPQPLKWFRGLIDAFGNDIKIRLVSKDGVPIASILTLLHRRSMVYKYGCSDAAFTKHGGTALLFWKTIQEARERGCEELDMGRSDIDNKGLIAFKERWGAVGNYINYRTYPSHSHLTVTTKQWKFKLVRLFVSAAPDFALKAVGNALYRHIG
jgi:hypothetical protein